MSNFPRTFTYSGERLLKMKRTVSSDSGLLLELREKAEALLSLEPLSVVKRRLKAVSGNPHDYMSMGPYWWPNPNTDDGLPYIRRDGEVNPETRDPNNYSKLSTSVNILSLAAFYFDDMKYAEKAVRLLSVWHLDEETYMAPHLEYGQSIPGICTGRGIGLIDFSSSYKLLNGVAILDFLGAIDEITLNGLKRWYDDFINWMLTSEIGADENNQHNNHGAWFDVQVAVAALFTGRPFLAGKILTSAYDLRLTKHICPDGKQPYELARTKSMHYSIYNYLALAALGNMAKLNGIKKPYWSEEGGEACLMRRAADFLYDYISNPEKYPQYSELSPDTVNDGLCRSVMLVDANFPELGYGEKVRDRLDDGMLWRLTPGI